MKTKTSIFLKQDYQVIYAIILITLIPLTIILNTIWSVKSFQKNIDVSLQRQALLVGQLFNVAVADKLDSGASLQPMVDAMSQAGLPLTE